MKIVSVSMVRNEEDIVELFVRHNLQVVDEMIFVAHLCTDRTVEILAALVSEGLPIHVARELGQGFYQGEILSREMKRAVRDLNADWVIPLDADEFIASDTGDARECLENMEKGKVHSISWKTYVPRASDMKEDSFLFDRIAHRREPEISDYCKVIVPGKVALGRRTFLKAGSHGVRDYSRFRHKTLPMTPLAGVFLAHFPVRSKLQMTLKALLSRTSLVAAFSSEGEVGWHYQPLLDALRRGEEISAEWLAEYGFNYALSDELRQETKALMADPISSRIGPGQLKYGSSSKPSLVPVLVRLAEDQAEEIAVSRRKVSRGGFWERFLRR